jgi:hypothetical protein
MKWPRCEFDCWPPARDEVRDALTYTSALTCAFISWHLINYRDKFNWHTGDSALLEQSGLYFFTLQRSVVAGGRVPTFRWQFVFASALKQRAHCIEYSRPYTWRSCLQLLVLPHRSSIFIFVFDPKSMALSTKYVVHQALGTFFFDVMNRRDWTWWLGDKLAGL